MSRRIPRLTARKPSRKSSTFSIGARGLPDAPSRLMPHPETGEPIDIRNMIPRSREDLELVNDAPQLRILPSAAARFDRTPNERHDHINRKRRKRHEVAHVLAVFQECLHD